MNNSKHPGENQFTVSFPVILFPGQLWGVKQSMRIRKCIGQLEMREKNCRGSLPSTIISHTGVVALGCRCRTQKSCAKAVACIRKSAPPAPTLARADQQSWPFVLSCMSLRALCLSFLYTDMMPPASTDWVLSAPQAPVLQMHAHVFHFKPKSTLTEVHDNPHGLTAKHMCVFWIRASETWASPKGWNSEWNKIERQECAVRTMEWGCYAGWFLSTRAAPGSLLSQLPICFLLPECCKEADCKGERGQMFSELWLKPWGWDSMACLFAKEGSSECVGNFDQCDVQFLSFSAAVFLWEGGGRIYLENSIYMGPEKLHSYW